jgi:hypothetical protein
VGKSAQGDESKGIVGKGKKRLGSGESGAETGGRLAGRARGRVIRMEAVYTQRYTMAVRTCQYPNSIRIDFHRAGAEVHEGAGFAAGGGCGLRRACGAWGKHLGK